MGGNGSFRSHRHDYLGSHLPHTTGEVLHNRQEILPIKAAIGVVEHRAAGDPQQLASGGKFLAANSREFIVGLGPAPVGGCLAWGEANHMGFHAAFAVMEQGAAKASRFVIRMGSKT
jgi:hypothetical protein